MKNIIIMELSLYACFLIFLLSCNSSKNSSKDKMIKNTSGALSYAYKATYSSDAVVPSHPEYAQMVLTVWKMFETKQIDAMKQYYADTVTYDPGNGSRFHGKSTDLLAYAAKDIDDLDSLRFDISTWESVHFNDKNEDWVYIWGTERRYSKNGTADTSLIHEQWKIEKGKVSYFNQYTAKPIR